MNWFSVDVRVATYRQGGWYVAGWLKTFCACIIVPDVYNHTVYQRQLIMIDQASSAYFLFRFHASSLVFCFNPIPLYTNSSTELESNTLIQ